jgi:histidinol-phosphate aminotransferase
MIQVKSHIAAMSKYSPPWSGMDRSGFLRLDLNENTTAPPEHVKQALKEFVDTDKFQMYPDYADFLPVLARYARTDEDRVMVTNGSDQAIEVLLRAFLGAGDTMLIAQPGFPIFEHVAATIGARVKGISYPENLVFPGKEFVKAITPEVKLIVIINPDNPTGVSVPEAVIEEIIVNNPDIPVIVDEAYFEFTNTTSLGLLDNCSNLIVTRTFSKAFAMAGLRLGYIIARSEMIEEFCKIRGPFDINSCALIAAEAQIKKQDCWKNYIQELMTSSKPYIEIFFNQKKITYFPGSAHFLLVKPKNRDQAVAYLRENNILVRPMFFPLIDQTFRMNIGTLSQVKRFVAVYNEYIEKFE